MPAQDDLHQDDRQALLKILDRVQQAINAQDVEGILAQMRRIARSFGGTPRSRTVTMIFAPITAE